MKAKVTFFLRRPRQGENYSIERLFDSVIAALPRERYEVRRLVCPFESSGLLRRVALIVWAALNQGDINHVTGDVNFIGLLMHGRRTVLTIHDSASLRRLSGWQRWLYLWVWVRLPIHRASRVTVVSEATLRETLSCVRAPRDKIEVIGCAVPQGLMRQAAALSGERPRVLAIGTKPNKNLPRIIEAMEGVACRLVVIGELSESDHAIARKHRVEIENHFDLDDAAMARQYCEADAVLFVPTYEGFGMPIIEAQAVGRPLITSRRSPMQDVAGQGACLVDPESVHEIRAAILHVMKDFAYRAQLVQAGFANVQSYTPQAIAARYAALYDEMLAEVRR